MEYPIWRLWSEKGIPLRELREEWTYDDLMKALAILDMENSLSIARDGFDKKEMEKVEHGRTKKGKKG